MDASSEDAEMANVSLAAGLLWTSELTCVFLKLGAGGRGCSGNVGMCRDYKGTVGGGPY